MLQWPRTERAMSALRILLIAAAAYAGALTTTSVVNAWLDSSLPASAGVQVSASQPGPSTQRPGERVNYSAIFSRNLFGSETVAAEPAAPDQAHAVAELALKGTANIEGHGFAVFLDVGTGIQDIFGIGDKVFEGPELVEVLDRSAVILKGGRRTTIEIEEGPSQPPEPGRAPGKIARAQTAEQRAGTGQGIRKTGEGDYLVDRREVDLAIEDLNTVVTQVRAIPFLRDGKSLGFRVFAIQPGSVFDRMGLRNGDVVQRINDQELSDPAKAAGLLDMVQNTSALKVDILRANKPSTFTYRIQ